MGSGRNALRLTLEGNASLLWQKKASAKWVLEADIQGCFDKISHDWMITNTPHGQGDSKEADQSGICVSKRTLPH
jgi:retron-type reverse transcriptase